MTKIINIIKIPSNKLIIEYKPEYIECSESNNYQCPDNLTCSPMGNDIYYCLDIINIP